MCIQQHGWFVVAGMGDDITPPGDILIVKVDEVDRGSETGIDLLQFVVMVLQATNATGFSTGKTDDLVPPDLKSAVQKGAGNNGSKSSQGKTRSTGKRGLPRFLRSGMSARLA